MTKYFSFSILLLFTMCRQAPEYSPTGKNILTEWGENILAIQFVPGLNYYVGNVVQGEEKILMDIAVSEF